MGLITYPRLADMREAATYDGAVKQALEAVEDLWIACDELPLCASGSKHPRLHRLVARTIERLTNVLFKMLRTPRFATPSPQKDE